MKELNLFEISGLGRIDGKNLHDDFSVKGIPSRMKSVITRRIGIIVEANKTKLLKAGRTGNPNNRRRGKDYADYTKMFILYQSDSIKNVKYLEAYYNDMLPKKYPKISKNLKSGSAGNLPILEKKHYLYIAIG